MINAITGFIIGVFVGVGILALLSANGDNDYYD